VAVRINLIGALGVACGLMFVAVALVRQHVRCDRHERVCTIRDWPLLAGEELRLDAIQEHEFWLMKAGSQWGGTLLVDRDGRRHMIAAGPVAAARRRFAEYVDFHEGRTDVVELASDIRWIDVFGGALIVLLAGAWSYDRRGGRRPADDLVLEWPER
jgi:hypothetical protein